MFQSLSQVETTNTRKLAAKLVENIRKSLPFELQEEFLVSIREGYRDLPVATLITGTWTVKQQFDVIRKSLKTLKTVSERLGQEHNIHWEKLTFILLHTIEDSVSLSTAKDVSPKNTHTTVASRKQGKSAPAALPDEPPGCIDSWVNEVERAEQQLILDDTRANSGLTEVPAFNKTAIKRALVQRLENNEILYATPGQKYVKCNVQNCKFCVEMYKNLDLTSCARLRHVDCIPGGFFPHVGVSMWKKVQRQHDNNQAFITKSPKPKSNALRLINLMEEPSFALSTVDFPELGSPHKRQRVSFEASCSFQDAAATGEDLRGINDDLSPR